MYKVAHQWRERSTGLDFDDLVQECWVVVIRAKDGYDPRRGAKFSTYAYRAMWNHLGNVRARWMRRSFHDGLSENTPDRSDQYARLDAHMDLERLMLCLTDGERRRVVKILNGGRTSRQFIERLREKAEVFRVV